MDTNQWEPDLQAAEKAGVQTIVHRDEYMGGKIWVLEREDNTNKLRFRNTLNGTVRYDKPFGLQLEDYEQEEWDKDQVSKVEGPTLINRVQVGEWV